MSRQTKPSAAAVMAPRTSSGPERIEPNGAPSAANGSHRASTIDGILGKLILFFSSLRLTVVCLGLGLVLVFVGTLAQVDLGLLKAQNEFFRSFLIYWQPKGVAWRIPVFPGGYLVGGLL